jgi:hypothetical protein
MPGEIFSGDSQSAASVVSLALMAGVHRNRVALWRLKGGPAGLNLVEWHTWLKRTGRSVHAYRLAKIMSGGAVDHSDASDDAIDAPDAIADQEPAPSHATGSTAPAADDAAGQSDDAVYWEARAARAKALRSELALDEDRRAAALTARDLITAAECRRLIMQLAAAVNDVIGQGIWHDLLIAMPGVPPHAQQYLRKQHGLAIITMRGRISRAARDVLDEITNQKTTKEKS